MGRMRFVLVVMLSVLLASLTLGQARAAKDGAAVATSTTPSTCTDGTDNDGDGLIDGADPDCDEGEQNITQCNDGVDNDGDGLTDVDDPDCKGGSGSSEFAGGGGPPPECGDGLDNDGDGLVDAADPDCDKGGPAACADGVDNDGDGLVDAADPDCKNASDDSEAPAPHSCDDGIDNDGDGLTDGADPDCDEGSPPPDNCTAAAGDPGLSGDNTIAQQVFDSPLGALPVLQDPDRDGPLSEGVNGGGDGTELEVLTDEVSCAVNLPVADL